MSSLLISPFPLSQVYEVAINASSSGNNVVVAGVAGKRIVPIYIKVIASGAVTASWQSSGGTVLDGPCSLAANGGYVEPYTPTGHFSTLSGEDLDLNLGSSVQVGGNIKYYIVT